MQIKTLNQLRLSISFLACASGVHAAVVTASPQAGATSYAAPGPMILSADAVSMLHGAGIYLDSFILLTTSNKGADEAPLFLARMVRA